MLEVDGFAHAVETHGHAAPGDSEVDGGSRVEEIPIPLRATDVAQEDFAELIWLDGEKNLVLLVVYV